MGWICKYCSTNNGDGDSQCIVCDKPRASSVIYTLTAKRARDLNLRGDIVVPPEFNVIGESAFSDRLDITSVELHPGVLKIMKNAFSGCKNLQRVSTSGELRYIGSKAFYDCKKLSSSNRPKAKKVSDDAYAVAPEPVVDCGSSSLDRSSSSTSPSSHSLRTTYTTTRRSSSSSGPGIKVVAGIISTVIFLAIAIFMFRTINTPFETTALHWMMGIVYGFSLLCLVIVISAALGDLFESCVVSTILFVLLSIANIIVLCFLKSEYRLISSLLNIAFVIGCGVTAVVSFDNCEPVSGWIDIVLLVANIFMLFLVPVIL